MRALSDSGQFAGRDGLTVHPEGVKTSVRPEIMCVLSLTSVVPSRMVSYLQAKHQATRTNGATIRNRFIGPPRHTVGYASQ